MEDLATKEYTRKRLRQTQCCFLVYLTVVLSLVQLHNRGFLQFLIDHFCYESGVCARALERRKIALHVAATVVDSVDNQYLCPVVA